MLIIPAIDIRHGSCVRLYQGRAEEETVYGKDPVEMALHWKAQGATMLHIADLDGAFDGHPVNLDLAVNMKNQTKLPVELGGGFRDIASVAKAIEAGIDKVILGTAAIYNPTLVIEAVARFGPAIAVSIDVSEDFVAVAGWKEISSVRFDALATRMREVGVQELLFTDTRRDGTLSGPNVNGIRMFLAAAKLPVIVCGGISTIEDLVTLKEFEKDGLKGVVIGKALYDFKISLPDALRLS